MSSHLTMEDLTAHVSGASLDAAVQAHLAECASCQAEAARWEDAAADVQRLLSPIPQSPPPLDDTVLSTVDEILNDIIEEPPEPKPRTRRRRLVRPLALTSFAVAAILALTTYALLEPADRTEKAGTAAEPTTEATISNTTDCSDLQITSGTIEITKGSSVVVRDNDGELTTVAISSETKISRLVMGGLDDITKGTRVFVRGDGTSSGSTIAADHIGVLAQSLVPTPPPREPAQPDSAERMAANGRTHGAVTDVRLSGFIVATPAGTEVRVTAAASTTVVVQAPATLNALETNKFTVVAAHANGGRAEAISIQQNALLPGQRDPRVRPPDPQSPNRPTDGASTARPADEGCDSEAIATDALLSNP